MLLCVGMAACQQGDGVWPGRFFRGRDGQFSSFSATDSAFIRACGSSGGGYNVRREIKTRRKMEARFIRQASCVADVAFL